MAAFKVLFIGGAGRSGSTLLETLLAQIDGVVSLGEFNEIWKAGIVEDRLCGCGNRFHACVFWNAVFEAAFGGMDAINVQTVVDAQDKTCRIRYIPRMAWPRIQSALYSEKIRTLRNLNESLLKGVRSVTGARVIVDSSKTPSQAYMLSSIDGIHLHVLQLVRDSRAVAFSWQRKNVVPDPQRGDREMVRKTSVQSALDWGMRHYFLNALKKRVGRDIESFGVLRYEDFAKSPSSVLSHLAATLGLEADVRSLFETPFDAKRNRIVHTLEGNPSKFRAGNIHIKADNEWQRSMRPLDRAVVSVLTAPYLKKFGYF